MARKTPQPPPRTELLVSRDSARAQIQERLAIGSKLRQKLQGPEGMQALKEAERWTSFNIEMLIALFSTEELSREYAWCAPPGVATFGPPTAPQRLVSAQEKLEAEMHELDSVIEKLVLYAEPQSAAAAETSGTPPTVTVAPARAFVVQGSDAALTQTGAMTALERQRFLLPHRAVLLATFDESGKQLTVASGFLRRERVQLYLYTCWHVVTGLDRNTRALPATGRWERPTRLTVTLQGYQSHGPGVASIGGAREFALDLYSKEGTPRWLQDRQYVPNADLASKGLRFPFLHDVVKLPFPEIETMPDTLQTDDSAVLPSMMVLPGDKVVIVGYPYGYSALETPTPVVITAHVAAMFSKERRMEFLLDRAGAPGMSGGPVFIEEKNQLWPMGMYTGAIYPDRLATGVPRVSTLGSCANLTQCWSVSELALVPADSPEMAPVETPPRTSSGS